MSSVDIVIPCYNYARYLPQSVASALDQEDVDVRILVIDDCSSDDTEKIGRQLAEQDSRVEFRRHSENRGHIATYNEGLLDWAKSDYAVLLSADDALAPGALARAAQIMDRQPGVVMTCGMGRVLWDEENYASKTETISPEFCLVPSRIFLERCFLMGNPVCTPTAVVRTELQHRLGGYRADLPHSGDMEMWMRFAVHGSIGVHGAVQAYYRRHSANMSIHYDSQLLGDVKEVLQACELILAQWGDQFPESSQWRESMLQRVSEGCCWLASTAFDRGDSVGGQACLEFAEQVYPVIRDSHQWRKIRAKMFLGKTCWQLIRPAWERIREYRKSLSGFEARPTSQSDQLTGWWPEPHGR
ncbi:MAG: glycosyltransferase [Geobacter sp.]|nr:glycosyltransferase [Geobacter sp.]